MYGLKRQGRVLQMLSNYAIKVENLIKQYQLFDKPSDRLKQMLFHGKKIFYREFNALQNISFEITEGKTVGIIGQNGSGKSTLLQILSGTLSPTSGKVKVNGRVAALLELGSGFNPDFTGRENVYLNGAILGLSKEEIDKRFEEIEKFADIGTFIDQPVKSYSSGMYVRLAFAVSINVDADILIIDEALAVGDVFFQAKCYKKFEEYKAAGKTVILVTHDLSSVIKYCDEVILLDKSHLIGIGTPKTMVDKYKKILVKIDDEKELNTTNNSQSEQEENWNRNYVINSSTLEYGDYKAEIIDYGIFNKENMIISKVDKESSFTIKMKVRFNKKNISPIFAFTIKDIKGTEITGTNTKIENVLAEGIRENDVKEVRFTQEMNLQGGEYFLSLGCTGFEGDEFVVYHRLYDIINFQVLSKKNSVGYFDMNSTIQINDI